MAFRKSENASTEPKFVIEEECGLISEDSKGNKVKLRLISWNGKPAKYDLRTWYVKEDGTEGMGKGITLSGEQLESLLKILTEMAND